MYDRLNEVRRPAIPLTLYALIACVGVERLVLANDGGIDGPCLRYVICGCIMIALGATGVLCKSGGKGVAGTILVVSLVVISALLRAQATAERVRDCASALSERAVSTFSFSVVGEASKTTYGFRSEAIACSNDTPIGNVWLRSEGRLARGQHLRCIGSFERNGADEWGERARMPGVSGTVHV